MIYWNLWILTLVITNTKRWFTPSKLLQLSFITTELRIILSYLYHVPSFPRRVMLKKWNISPSQDSPMKLYKKSLQLKNSKEVSLCRVEMKYGTKEISEWMKRTILFSIITVAHCQEVNCEHIEHFIQFCFQNYSWVWMK